MVDESSKRPTRSHHKGSKTPASEPNLSDQIGRVADPALSAVTSNAVETNEAGSRQTLDTTKAENNQPLELDSDSDEDETFKDLTEPKENPGSVSKYKGILSNIPKIVTSDELSVSHEDQVRDNIVGDNIVDIDNAPSKAPSTLTLVHKSDKSILWDKIAEAVVTNDKTNTDFFIRLYSQINDTSSSLKPEILRSRSTDAANAHIVSSSSKKPSEKTSIIFVRGSLPKHFDVGFTPYFDKNIKELRGPIPLTIFDKKWQEDAIQFHTNKRSKGDEKDGSYTGFEYPNEWTQTFAKWTANHRNFHITFRDLYNYPEFAEWILEHKANVDRIIAEDGFLVGFRYDLIVRQNAFSYQVETDQGTSAVDISIFRKNVKREAWKVTRNLDELDFTDNPYAKDGPKFNFDPKTGKPKGKVSDDSSHQNDPRNSSKGRGNFRNGRGSDRFFQDRRHSDYGGHREDPYTYDNSPAVNKRPRETYQGDENFHSKYDYQSHRGGYGKDRGNFGRGGTSKGPTRGNSDKGKEKEIP
ncbi:hypothetical protein PGT21_028343 [Puccinia graminis f. sp. tritici]|uniref:Uncharacterized protein n=1 Tax=Puccinia graminis f. sp. tritici TaxID=56615 RepID=A0A5B0M4N9_PUCGR|nr:hypothetical protein PGT21_028343 [Puccinia graminis f. sp. tritici]